MTTAVANFDQRLREIDMFFSGEAPIYHAMRRLTDLLRQTGISYAIMGGMAVNLHGAERTTKDLDVLLTPEGLRLFRERLVGQEYDQVPGKSRKFVDRQHQVSVDILVTGHFPGHGEPAPFAFPDPGEASEEIHGTRVVTLVHLVQLKLAARRYYDFGDVVFLIRVHGLDEAFADRLHPAVRDDYTECLEEKRREDEYNQREEPG